MKKKRRKRWRRAALGLLLLLILVVAGSIFINRWKGEAERIALRSIPVPDWIEQRFFDLNPYSRPGTKIGHINGIVIHYVANKGTSAEGNWNYFNNLAKEKTTSASSHFIIGLAGEILQGVPLDEIAYASKHRNKDTISIECCHPGEDGKFNGKTYESLIRLTAWLCGVLHLTEEDVIRHYDVTKKLCPKYYVEHEEAWAELLRDVKIRIRDSNLN